MAFLDPAVSSLDAAVKFGLELGHDLHSIEIIESEILEDGVGTATNVKDEEDFKPAGHNLIFQRPCYDEDDDLSSKLISEYDELLQTLGLTFSKDAFLSKLQPDSAATVNLDNFTSSRPLQSTAMELHRRIESLEVQLETKEQELVASKNDIACLQRSHIELVASNDKLLQLYEKTKSKRSVLSDSESRACRMNERRQREKAERLATAYKSLLDERKSLEGSAESRYRNLVRSYAKLSAENRHLRGELMQHKGLIKSKQQLPSENSLETPPSWPVLPPPLKGFEIPHHRGDSSRFKHSQSPPPNKLKEACDVRHHECSSGTVIEA